MRHIHFNKNITVWLARLKYLPYSKLIFLILDSYFMPFHTIFKAFPIYKLCITLLYPNQVGREMVVLFNL